MLTDIKRQKRFKQDYKLMIKQNRDISLLNGLIVDLYNETPLPRELNDHKLVGNYLGYRECHVAGLGDWLLIYKTEDNVLKLVRTGSHSELFD
ncbi:MAG: type II toxin-antitoxin system YafQ family toxin [Firmicutes bacterium]|nr:type II toxin-antitoxin system YafQ family toxin [Bacillota bacterium]